MQKSDAKSILVADDEMSICELCRRVLTREGFDVDIANSGDMALRMLSQKDYTLILLDMKIPKLDGVEVYLFMKEKLPQLAKRVIFTSGSMLRGSTREFLENSGRPFLPKPFTPGELREMVKEFLRG